MFLHCIIRIANALGCATIKAVAKLDFAHNMHMKEEIQRVKYAQVEHIVMIVLQEQKLG